MPVITDLRIEPLPNQSQFSTGLLHITPTIRLQGSIKFTSLKPKLKSVRLLFLATVTSALKQYVQDHTVFTQSNVLLSKPGILSGCETDKNDSVLVNANEETCYQFDIIIPETELNGFPGTVSYEPRGITTNAFKGDAINVSYTLIARIETLDTLFIKSKVFEVEEPVDLPAYNLPKIIESRNADTSVFISGMSDECEYRVSVSRGVFTVGQTIHFNVHHVRSVEQKGLAITKILTRIRQDVIIEAKERVKTISSYIAHGVGTFATKDGSWSGESDAVVESTHVFHKKNNLTIDAFSTMSAGEERFEIKHFAELCVVLKDSTKELKFETPVHFEAVDSETKEWLITHANKLSLEE